MASVDNGNVDEFDEDSVLKHPVSSLKGRERLRSHLKTEITESFPSPWSPYSDTATRPETSLNRRKANKADRLQQVLSGALMVSLNMTRGQGGKYYSQENYSHVP
ncbi:hypothetical protein BCON_0083g00100 [Botryotinia convoluta]|uniref:Uncharacterized protein n=1 Tax=Botryotinia convoluta TaxID=54673 RepID=A0A4Z1I2U2_9HELO|nr:hypothetical protein BCON_0083g00100 [Botryotinia convoluta]